ncbi:MAG TPA: TrbI/VirB10 family protein [Candidatus Binataceae bacterium]|nr:TrbI/VirB10 family protein [Candidatus Binataceae bacterium]
MAAADEVHEQEEQEQEQLGGGRFNRLLGVIVVAVAMLGGIVIALGVQSSGTSQDAAVKKAIDDAGSEARDRGEVADLAAHGAEPHPAPSFALPPAIVSTVQAPIQRGAPKAPSRYAQWAQEKFLKALEAPEMVAAFHAGQALEIASARGQSGNVIDSNSSSDSGVKLHPPASPYTVMAGSVIPAVLVSGINSDLPGPIIAQVAENVFDSATGKYLLIPQGSRLIGAYRNASAYGQERVQIAWRRLIFPNSASMDLPGMPGADQSGFAGFTDRVNNHYLATFGTAALMSLISAGQMVGQMAAFGGGGLYGPYGYYQPNQWAMAGEMAGSAASGQLGSAGQQMLGSGMNRPPTIEIRPGYRFNVMVTSDLVLPGPYGK